jgi:hypothetical protein
MIDIDEFVTRHRLPVREQRSVAKNVPEVQTPCPRIRVPAFCLDGQLA